MTYTIENELLSVSIAAKGAELQHLIHKEHQLDYLWSGDPAFWGKKSPVLFPIVGGLKNNSYLHEGKRYTMGRHGFARDIVFQLKEQSDSAITFSLASNDETKAMYPFEFVFEVKYSLQDNQLDVCFSVVNTGNDTMYCSLGAHPAFAVPLVNGLRYEDYYLLFDKAETAPRWPLTKDGLIQSTPQPMLQQEKRFPLKKELFAKDAIVFKHLESTAISLLSDHSPIGIKVSFEGFPYMGIWAAPKADFVCIEPWQGIADHEHTTSILQEKEGIMRLEAGHRHEAMYTIQLL